MLSTTQWLAVILAPFVVAGLSRGLMGPAMRYGIVDQPGRRKVHDHPTPLVGGIAMLSALLALQLTAGLIPFGSLSLICALLLVTGIGIADDARDLSHRSKFVAQGLAALIIISGTSVLVTHLGDLLGYGVIGLGKWSLAVTVIAFVGVMNAITMIDGLDGLACSVSVAPVVLMAYLTIAGGAGNLTFELLLLAGAIFGFLSQNLRIPGRPKALVFMGDTGGMLIGLLLAWFSVKLAVSPTAIIHPITAVWLLAVPLLDMGSVLLLRIYQRRSPFRADQQHLHHALLGLGLTVNQVVAIMAGFSLLLGVIAIVAERLGVAEAVMFFTFLGLWSAYLFLLTHPARLLAIVRPMVPAIDPDSET